MKIMSQKITVPQLNRLTSKQKKTLITLLGILLVIGVFYLFAKNNKVSEQQLSSEQGIPVVVAPVQSRMFERFVAVQGNLESKNFAVVSPRISGTLEQIYVDEGNDVIKGQNKLFRTDSIKLGQAVEIQQRLLDVEESARQQAIANLEKTEADFHKAELDYQRFKRLFDKKVVTADAYEQQESRYKQLIAAIKLSKANVDLAAANVQRAKADLAISKKDLADTIVYAPITGKISHRFKEPGETGQLGEPVVQIDDTSLIETSAYLPAQYYTEIIPNQTMIEVVVSGKSLGQFPVSYKSPTINPTLRTFEVKCLINNSSETVAAGAMADIRIILETKQGLAVPSTSIQLRDNKSVVFTVSGDKAHTVTVQTGIENHGWTEVISDKLNEQSSVVTMGQDMLDDGRLVSVQKEGD